MSAFLEKYGIAIFVLVIVGIMVALASPLGSLVENTIHNEVEKFTNTTVEDCEGGEIGEETLKPGLYAEDGTMLYNWDELMNTEYYCNCKTVSGTFLTVDENNCLKYGSYSCDNCRGDYPNQYSLEGYKLIISDSENIKKVDLYQNNFFEIVVPNGTESVDGFSSSMNLKTLRLPNTVKNIYHGINPNLTEIYYDGTIAEWNMVGFYESPLGSPGVTVYCLDGEISVPLCEC